MSKRNLQKVMQKVDGGGIKKSCRFQKNILHQNKLTFLFHFSAYLLVCPCMCVGGLEGGGSSVPIPICGSEGISILKLGRSWVVTLHKAFV